MTHSGAKPRFRSNHVELVIFSAVGLIVLSSLHSLLQDWGNQAPTSRQPSSIVESHTPPIAAKIISPEVNLKFYTSLELPCDGEPQLHVQTQKVHFHGGNCFPGTTEIKILNQKARRSASVFLDAKKNSFQTDYISLEPGQNTLRVEHLGANHTTQVQLIHIERN